MRRGLPLRESAARPRSPRPPGCAAPRRRVRTPDASPETGRASMQCLRRFPPSRDPPSTPLNSSRPCTRAFPCRRRTPIAAAEAGWRPCRRACARPSRQRLALIEGEIVAVEHRAAIRTPALGQRAIVIDIAQELVDLITAHRPAYASIQELGTRRPAHRCTGYTISRRRG